MLLGGVLMYYDNENVLTKEQIGNAVKKIIERDNYYTISKVVLFGSYARGEAERNSDIDLVVYDSPLFHGLKVYSFIGDLKEMLKKDIDLFVDRNIVKDSNFYKNILKEGINIYCN